MRFTGSTVPILVSIVLASLLSLAGAVSARPLHAQSSAPPPDLACRDCHGGSEQTYTFPSGETVTVGIDLAMLDAAPHSAYGTEPVPCTACHSGSAARYRYPHQPNPAQTTRDFRVEVSANCEGCHYPHQPFHPIVGSDTSSLEGDLPVCADCHGSHDIAPVEAIPEDMPDRCLACHSNQDDEWISMFLQPRPGLGQGADGYAGSTRCNGCHDETYFTWHDTLHAQLIQDIAARPEAVLGEFDVEGSEVPFGLGEVAYTVGSRWRQAYLTWAATGSPTQTVTSTLTNTVASTLQLLPMQWLVESATWAALEEGGEPPDDWITECGSCHVTGLNLETWGFTEFGIGCEACHGPAAAHAADPENVKPFAEVDDQVCGACHSRGTSPEGHPFPGNFRPGESLDDHFILTTSDEYLWPNGSAKYNHQQYMDWHLDNTMVASPDIRCVTCHAVHGTGEATGQLQSSLNGLCVDCHGRQSALGRHTPFHQQAMSEREFLCTDCHMPLMATTAEPFDLHNHSFLQPAPDETIAHGGMGMMPNACNLCHNADAETPEWAAQTIAHAQSLAPDTSFFGPGPTPTSPPPPTPMPSVGQVATLEVTPPFWWLRWMAFIVGGLIVAGVLVWIGLAFRSRRTSNG